MHILLGLVSLLTVVGGIIFWLRMVSRATKGAIELTDDVRAAFRRFGFTAKSQTDPLDAVDDPRVAAVGIFIALARMDGWSDGVWVEISGVLWAPKDHTKTS